MYAFHVTIHARPPAAQPGDEVLLDAATWRTVRVEPALLAGTPFSCSFEEAQRRLEGLERMYCEPDGSFVWVSSQSAAPWQIDGNLYDQGERLLFVDAKGTCPASEFDRLLQALGWPGTPLVFQLVRQAILLDEAEFRRWAEHEAARVKG